MPHLGCHPQRVSPLLTASLMHTCDEFDTDYDTEYQPFLKYAPNRFYEFGHQFSIGCWYEDYKIPVYFEDR